MKPTPKVWSRAGGIQHTNLSLGVENKHETDNGGEKHNVTKTRFTSTRAMVKMMNKCGIPAQRRKIKK
jgi:hypothetical protein